MVHSPKYQQKQTTTIDEQNSINNTRAQIQGCQYHIFLQSHILRIIPSTNQIISSGRPFLNKDLLFTYARHMLLFSIVYEGTSRRSKLFGTFPGNYVKQLP